MRHFYGSPTIIIIFYQYNVIIYHRLPLVIGVRTQVHPFVVQRVRPGGFLIFGAHEVPEAPLVQIGTAVHQHLDHGRILVDNGHVQHALSCHRPRDNKSHLNNIFVISNFNDCFLKNIYYCHRIIYGSWFLITNEVQER